MQSFDAIVIGAGAAGLFCAGVAAQRGLRVLVIDHSPRVAEKIRISGGGRCNFTNRDMDPRAPQRHYVGQNPTFARSALSRYTAHDFVALVQRHRIPFHEKHKGQLFCDHSADDIIQMLLRECEAGAAGGQVTRWQPCAVKHVAFSASIAFSESAGSYEIDTDQGRVCAPALVVATGGLAVPKIGATDFGMRLARQFGLKTVPTRPALVPLTFDEAAWQPLVPLAGLSLPVQLAVGEKKQRAEFHEDLLFTHRGLSGPGVLQISSFWQEGQAVELNLLPEQPDAPDFNLLAELQQAKRGSKKRTANELARWLPARLADACCNGTLGNLPAGTAALLDRPINEVPDKALLHLAEQVQRWRIAPNGTEGYRKAEAMSGGVDTSELSQQSLEAKRQPGLHFIGEVVDITGWLGGYNFQWAWASAHACAQALQPRSPA
jgi:predicted Rossmann fold flavoprotein